MKVSILCFDLSDNAAGRAHLLARLLAPIAEVEVVGPRHGAGRLAAGGRRRRRATSASRRAGCPRFAAAVPALLRAADGDLLYASKPRLGSAGIGLLKRRLGRRPLLLDIDDWEVGFFLRGGAWGTAGRALNWGNPRGLPWTWLMERAARAADADHGGLALPAGALRRHAHPARARHRRLAARA